MLRGSSDTPTGKLPLLFNAKDLSY